MAESSDKRNTKKCAICEAIVPIELLACPQCGFGAFETEKRRKPIEEIEDAVLDDKYYQEDFGIRYEHDNDNIEPKKNIHS